MHGGQDQGFCINYAKLSYRRKFLRTIWMAAIGILFAAAVLAVRPETRTNFTFACLAVMVLIASSQAIYNFRRWQTELPAKPGR